jgi:hypothetical protein
MEQPIRLLAVSHPDNTMESRKAQSRIHSDTAQSPVAKLLEMNKGASSTSWQLASTNETLATMPGNKYAVCHDDARHASMVMPYIDPIVLDFCSEASP